MGFGEAIKSCFSHVGFSGRARRSEYWWIIMLVFCCIDSDPDNEYGPSPKPTPAPVM